MLSRRLAPTRTARRQLLRPLISRGRSKEQSSGASEPARSAPPCRPWDKLCRHRRFSARPTQLGPRRIRTVVDGRDRVVSPVMLREDVSLSARLLSRTGLRFFCLSRLHSYPRARSSGASCLLSVDDDAAKRVIDGLSGAEV